ncbi:MAG TPA: leucyl/phenylalanyl-tRNA--protein transferase [Nitrosospira sp.]|nr:leucyl/phenylalanyl-tRNA--protein transferase [Nitrosospira sp.]
MIPWLAPESPFPPLHTALLQPSGLLAVGGDLSPKRLIAAYRRGIFPWYNEGDPILWWSPDPRMVLLPKELRVTRSLGKSLKRGNYEIRVDSAFDEVIRGCAAPRGGHCGTWIHEEMISAYRRLHEIGLAHSVETWVNQELVGGLYGVAIGKVFFGESMFSRVSDASKIAFVHLVRQLDHWGFGMIDCQMKTTHLASFGAREIPREDFSQKLKELVNYPGGGDKWCFDHEQAE